MWQCQKCKRQFAKMSQWHSCVAATVGSHFKGKPKLKEAFDYLLRQLKKAGNIRIDAVKSAINLGGRSHFGMAAVQKEAIRIGFVSPKPLKSSRLEGGQQLGNIFLYHLKIRSKKDIDEELLGWLAAAYRLKNYRRGTK